MIETTSLVKEFKEKIWTHASRWYNPSFPTNLSRVCQTLSAPHRVFAGVPQCSILSPIVLNIFFNDSPTHFKVVTTLYADLHLCLPSLQLWYSIWTLEIIDNKSEAIYPETSLQNLFNSRLFYWKSSMSDKN